MQPDNATVWRDIATAPQDGTWIEALYWQPGLFPGDPPIPEVCLISWRKWDPERPPSWAFRWMEDDDLPFMPTHWRPFEPPDPSTGEMLSTEASPT